jgi:hypothetical protein
MGFSRRIAPWKQCKDIAVILNYNWAAMTAYAAHFYWSLNQTKQGPAIITQEKVYKFPSLIFINHGRLLSAFPSNVIAVSVTCIKIFRVKSSGKQTNNSNTLRTSCYFIKRRSQMVIK